MATDQTDYKKLYSEEKELRLKLEARIKAIIDALEQLQLHTGLDIERSRKNFVEVSTLITNIRSEQI